MASVDRVLGSLCRTWHPVPHNVKNPALVTSTGFMGGQIVLARTKRSSN